jgi:hypothetical protein
VGWWVYGVLGWVALAVFFWCLLLVAARADCRDADVSPRELHGPAKPRSGRRFVWARHQSGRRGFGGLARARYAPQAHLVERGEPER